MEAIGEVPAQAKKELSKSQNCPQMEWDGLPQIASLSWEVCKGRWEDHWTG